MGEKKGTSSAKTYLVVTGATSNYSSSMCVSVTFLGGKLLAICRCVVIETGKVGERRD